MNAEPVGSPDSGTTRLELRADHVFGVGLAFVMIAAFWNGRDLWFSPLDWNLVVLQSHGVFAASFQGNWMPIPTLFYRLAIAAFGTATTVPIRLVGLAWFWCAVVLFHRWARTRLAGVPAAFAALAITWSGLATDVVMEPALMCITIPLAMLFATWLFIEGTHRWSLGKAAACLTIGVLASNIGMMIVVIVAMELAARRSPMRRWLALLPATFVWTVWFLLSHNAPGPRVAPSAMLAWAWDVTFGLVRGIAGFAWPLALIGLAIGGFWIAKTRRWNPRSIGVAGGILVFWLVGSFRSAPGGLFPAPSDASWLAWLLWVLVIVIVVESCAGIQIPRGALVVSAAVVFVGILTLIGSLSTARQEIANENASSYIWFVAVEAVGGIGSRNAVVPIGTVQTRVTDLAPLFRAQGSVVSGVRLHQFGEENTGHAADLWMLTELGVELKPGFVNGGVCKPVSDQLLARGEVTLSGAQVEISAIKMPANVYLRRFASQSPSIPFAQVPALQTRHFLLPKDNSSTPWVLQVDGAARVLVCQ